MAVTIEQLRFQNGFTYRDCTVPLARQGLVYISGPNGHGKSTPFEVLQHVFFGTTSRGVKKDAIGCAIPGSDGFVAEVTLTNPDGRWLIRQSRNHSRHKTAVKVFREIDGEWSLSWPDGGCPKRLDDAQKLAGTLLGLQQHEFAGCMYLSQASAHTLIEGTPSEKMRYIAQLFGLDVCDRMIAKLKTDIKEAEKLTVEADVLEARYTELKAERASFDAPRPEDLECMRQAIDVARFRRNDLRDLIYDARDAVAAAEQRDQLIHQRAELRDVGKVADLTARRAKLRDKRDDLLGRLHDVQEADRIKRELAAFGDAEMTAQELNEREAECVREMEKCHSLVEALERRQSVEASLAALPLGGQPEALQEAVTAAHERSTAAGLALRAKREEVERLTTAVQNCQDGVCPTCLRELDVRQMRKLAKRAVAEIACLEAAADEADRHRAEVSNQLENAERRRRLSEKLAEMPDQSLDETLERLQRLRDEQQRFQDLRDVSIQRSALQQRLQRIRFSHPDDTVEALEPSLRRTEVLLDGLDQEIERATKAEELDRQIQKIAAIDGAGQQATADLAERVLERLESDDEILRERFIRAEVATQQYREICDDLEVVEAKLAESAESRQRVHDLGYAMQTVQKLKRRKLREVVEAIRDCLPRFASTMFSHERNTRFVVSNADEESLDLIGRRKVGDSVVDIPVKSFSGGEKQRLSVALVFTLHALLHARKRPDLLILDEVDRGLDELGIASLMSLVREVRQQYGTVIMTSHRAQIAGAAFDQTWTVEKHDETSRLTTEGAD